MSFRNYIIKAMHYPKFIIIKVYALISLLFHILERIGEWLDEVMTQIVDKCATLQPRLDNLVEKSSLVANYLFTLNLKFLVNSSKYCHFIWQHSCIEVLIDCNNSVI